MRFQTVIQYISRFLNPTRVLIALMLVSVLYFLPLNSKPAFIEQNGQILEIAQVHPVLQSVYPQGIYAACGEGGPGSTNCHTGCCSAGQCVVCPPNEDPVPPTISANLNCSNWGDNGWCKGSLSIDLSAADPQGQAVVISGAVNGNNFACPSGATSCSIPLSGEGTGSVSYQVNSATGLSAAGALGYQIDLTSPDLDTSVSGAAGTNGWYRSDVTLSVSASDATSGIASITASINGGGATTVNGPLTFSDGEYSVLIVARDNAGHQTQDTQIIKVDTITPSLSFTSSGTNGKNGWYVSSASAAATASDSGSGLASIEASVDGGSWTVSDSISLSDGVHTYQFRATDVAGNKTETPMQTAMIDTIAPSISMSQGTSLGEKVLYEIEDYGSGLSIFRAVIEDDGEQYQKVTWSGDISGSYIADDILWDGKFADGARAGIGEYMVTLKITDAAGNKAIKTTFVTVGLLDLLDDIPAFSPPVSSTSEEDEIPTTASATGPQTFGGIQTTTDAGEFISTTTTVPGITIPTTDIPIDPNILWGAAASAMVGATLADWQRKREEEERRKAEAQEEKRANTEKRWGLKKQEDAVRQRWAVEKAAEEMAQSRTADSLRWAGLASVAQAQQAVQQAQDKAAFDHRMDEHTGEQDKVDAWNAQQADAARWAGLAAMEQKKEPADLGGGKPLAMPANSNEPKWWEKAIDWVDDHQVITSIGIGLAVGVGAAAIIATGGLATPLVVVTGAALVAGSLTAGGTMALNAYEDRPLTQNLISNVGTAATVAVVAALAPIVVPAGQAVVGSAATTASMYAYALGASWVGTAATFTAPAVGFGWSLWTLGSLGAIGYGISLAADPTLTDDERQDGAIIGALGVESLDAAVNVYETADFINKMSAFAPQIENPLLSRTGKSDGSSLTEDQAKMIDSVNKQLLKDFGGVLPKGVTPIDPNKVDFLPGTEFGPGDYGYYSPSTGRISINLDMDGFEETLIHENLHFVSDNGQIVLPSGEKIYRIGFSVNDLNSDKMLNVPLNEGVTEYYTRQVASNMGITDPSIAYPDEVKVANALTDKFGDDMIKNKYFTSDVDGLQTAVDSELGAGAFNMINELLDLGDYPTVIKIINNGLP